mgnify:CR=1 FL=1|tara:strand:- start:772 stop:942 length:171 start_codon:yes stop_codon:yes gene_type:complete
MKLLTISFCLIAQIAIGQISGTVKAWDGEEEFLLPGASVFWAGTNIGTTTDSKGYF